MPLAAQRGFNAAEDDGNIGVRFAGAEQARPAADVQEAIAKAEAVVIAPSNPITSIGPILAVPGIREALNRTRATVAAISPIINNAAVSGPAFAPWQRMGNLEGHQAPLPDAWIDKKHALQLKIQARMRERGLPESLATRLERGI